MNYFFYEELGLTFFMLNWILVSPNNRPELVRPIGKPSPLLKSHLLCHKNILAMVFFFQLLFLIIRLCGDDRTPLSDSEEINSATALPDKVPSNWEKVISWLFFFLVFPTVCISIEQIRPGFQKTCMSLVKGVRKKLLLDMKRCSGSLVISKMQIKTTTNSCFISSSLGKVKEIWQ